MRKSLSEFVNDKMIQNRINENQYTIIQDPLERKVVLMDKYGLEYSLKNEMAPRELWRWQFRNRTSNPNAEWIDLNNKIVQAELMSIG